MAGAQRIPDSRLLQKDMMMSTLSSSAALGRALLTFAVVMIAAQAFIWAVSYIWPAFEIPSAMGLIIVMSSALGGGQVYATNVGRTLTMGEKSRFALGATAISLTLMVAVLYGIFAFAGEPVTFENLSILISGTPSDANEIRDWLWVFIAGIAALTFVLTWLAAAFGARSAIKARDKRAAAGR